RRTVDLSRVADVVGAPEHRARAAEIARRSITLVRDRSALVPLVPLRDRRILVVAHSDDVDPFVGRALTRTLARDLAAVERAVLPAGAPVAAVDSLRRQADAADVVVVALDVRVRSGKGSLALAEPVAAAVQAIAERRPTIVVSLGSPYVLRQLPELGSYLIAWGSDEVSQVAAAEALVGRAPITGRLPIAIPPLHGRGDGLTRAAGLEPDPGPTGPARATGGPALDSATLDSIARTIRRAIETRVTPGAVVAVGRSGGPAWVRAIGRTDPAPEAPAVEPSTVYDLASLTKVVGTTSAVMTLVADGRMELDAPLARYLPGWSTGGTRGSVTIRRLLTHTAGLPPFVRFWHRSAGALRGRDAFVAAIDSIGPIRTPGERYVYSDLGFILLGAAVEAVTDTTLDGYLDARLWTPLGMDETGFNPTGDPGGGGTGRGGLPLDRIAPTEVDTVFRHEHVHGVVHDENAFAMGGVAGHAGLFSTAPDLARFARMLLGAGRVDGRAVIPAATVARFTTRQPGWDRALGWDAAAGTTIAEPFSARAFGHTGFTGTSLWVDPDRDLYVILLTNRVNPTRARGGIGELRRAVHGLAVRAADRWGG
ncbi:MAG: serine hydrolase, partial [Gemmatimonadetes bacterium]|nr:beta-lactamase family protein [Gemmatimonadota bacterium]NIX45860.1 serine hydrolase [Gemmatimonadota bacterium]